MSGLVELSAFLANKTFEIPSYQRDYSWGRTQVDDLLNDIDEAVEGELSHYLGTFVLSRADGRGPYEIVDGQQRLTTLVLVLSALLRQLPTPKQNKFASVLRNMFTDRLKMHFGVNNDFAIKLLSEKDFWPRPQSDDDPPDAFQLTGGRRRLGEGYQLARERAQSLHEEGGDDRVLQWIEAITRMEIFEFSASDTDRAIRIFHTINDRGLALSAMDKAKALLIYYSNRYLGGELDKTVNHRFGRCFIAFDSVKELVAKEEYRVGNIYQADFRENDLLRYHYLAYEYPEIVGGGEYNPSDHTVLDGFLKETMLKHYKSTDKLKSFINDYTRDLCKFFEAFQELVDRIKISPRLYKLFVVLGFSARLYPLLVRLHQRGILEKTFVDGEPDLLNCLEICDMRVYKLRIRGSSAAADIGKLSRRSRTLEPREIGDWLWWITDKLMPEYVFRDVLTAPVFGGAGVDHMLIEYDEYRQGELHTLDKLMSLVRKTITREHVLPTDPGLFDVTSYGFADEHEYREHVDRLGNILPLTSKMNSFLGNKSPQEKMRRSDRRNYHSSCYVSTRKFATRYKGEFHKDDLVSRTERLADWVMDKWCLWE